MKHLPRVIPVLLISDGALVKTVKFANPVYLGDPVNIIRIFNEKEVDEIIIIDLEASKKNRPPDFGYVSDMASECFMPVTYGGGVKTLDHAEKLFRAGVEKISVQTGFRDDPGLIDQLARTFGSQSLVASIDVKVDWLRRKRPWSYDNQSFLNISVFDQVRKLIEYGVGEIFINSVDRDGTMEGFDLQMIAQLAKVSSVPFTMAGGLGSLEDIRSAWQLGVSGVAGGAFFVFQGPHRAVLPTYPSLHLIKQVCLEGKTGG